MNCIKRIITSVLASIIIFSCNEPVHKYSRVDFVIPEHINIRKDELKKLWGEEKTDQSSGIYIVITLYSYSTGSETISFSGSGEIQTVRGNARVKCLVRIMNGKEVLRAEFIEASGDIRDEMLSSLIRQIRDRLFK